MDHHKQGETATRARGGTVTRRAPETSTLGNDVGSCPPCTGNCRQGRDCPARRTRAMPKWLRWLEALPRRS
ncbi:hypothetical protein EV663_11723 [Rhodovulum bhavnagarense]|uniref:Uncharacterized protein n=1 Tax=Rhodovulum bhavnagarense TaxID=992286 RepID=A0A4R2R9W6_9RHOB|nr:hypothetical protein EV663_11723 [Rhodovulum bhavnagarense]